MTRSGTLSYFEGPQSDHRGLYVDLDLGSYFNRQSATIPPPEYRYLQTGNPERVSYYHAEMMKYYKSHNMEKRIDDLHDTHLSKTREEVRRLLTAWDNDQGRAMLSAERSLRQPPKKYQWSPILRNSAIVRRYWKLRLREVQKGEDYQSTFARWQEQLQVHDPAFTFPRLGEALSQESIRERLNSATRVFRKCQRSSTTLRMKTYQELLETYEEDKHPTTRADSLRKAKIVRRTIAGEVCRNTFRHIGNIVKPTIPSSITKILVPRRQSDDNAPTIGTYHLLQTADPSELIWDTIFERDDIEQHLLHYNRESFRAAAESPCGHGLIHDAITFSSLSDDASELLSGTVPPEWYGDDDTLREFLASFAIPAKVKDRGDLSTEVSEDDICRGFQKWPESTSTSPSGRHLGHYKALVQHPTLLKCFHRFLNIAISRGIAIPRWCHATNVMIEKDQGHPRINRLRIIHLFEADLNFFLKLQWGHRLVRRACELNLLNSGQHGSVPRRTTMDPIMLTQLTTDLCRILKHDLARFDNDASACFDRIIVALGMLAARRCGMPKNAIQVHADALHFMQYTVKTIYGISADNYHGTGFEPLWNRARKRSIAFGLADSGCSDAQHFGPHYT
ncbi:hypothetical protein MHU86_14151 [Fragilaria crotonensis]|nr:hypothetical protein MHU86_14151 [Fragilaria crotonensis]